MIFVGCCLLWLQVGEGSAQGLSWEPLAEGMAVAIWEPGPGCRNEIPPLVIVKIDPERYRLATYHYSDEGLSDPPTIQEWQERTRAVVMFNAGLFREDYSYMGLLIKDGRSLGSKQHPLWKGLLVAEPVTGGKQRARVLDLAVESFVPDRPGYHQAAQSLMLLDRAGKPRVQRSGKRAHQTVVGEDRTGSLLLMKTSGEVPLWELATCLRDGLRELNHAMVMDGGASSDLLIETNLLNQGSSKGTTRVWQSLVDGSGQAHIGLPAVIGVMPRRGGPSR